MIPGLNMYKITCSHCCFSEFKCKRDDRLFHLPFKIFKTSSKSCKCPQCGKKAREQYIGPAH